MSNYKVGLVVPIYTTKFIKRIIEYINLTYSNNDLIICIVNDAQPEVKKYLDSKIWPDNVEIINLESRGNFAGANNAGWKYLIDKYTNLKYLGSLNDDTIPKNGWLEKMIFVLEGYPKTALAMPIMETSLGFLKTKKNFACWRLKGSDNMEPINSKIKNDSFVSAVNGFCFVADKNALVSVNFLDDEFKNGCEDLDLGIKLLLNGWRMVTVKDSKVYHIGGSSRYIDGNNKILDNNHVILAKKYSNDVEKFNNLNESGFLIIRK